jgi:hypothetical protein
MSNICNQGRSLPEKPTALPANFRLLWKCLALANTLAYYDARLITIVKSFMIFIPEKEDEEE